MKSKPEIKDPQPELELDLEKFNIDEKKLMLPKDEQESLVGKKVVDILEKIKST